MDRDEMWEMQRWMTERALEPLKDMVESGMFPVGVALKMLVDQSKDSMRGLSNPEFDNFVKSSSLIFENEPTVEAGYDLGFGGEYVFKPASHSNMSTLYKLYKQFSGEGFSSPEELRDIMRKALGGKCLLEIGCGTGHNLKVLENLGAKAKGIELRESLVGLISGADVVQGDAANMDKILKGEQFDVIYSSDVFCKAVMDREKAKEIAFKTADYTKDGGLGIHDMIYQKMELPLYLFSIWAENREGNYLGVEEQFWNMSHARKEDALYTNESVLDPQFLIRADFDVPEYAIENGVLTVVAKKK